MAASREDVLTIKVLRGLTEIGAALGQLEGTDLPQSESRPFSSPGFLLALFEAYHAADDPRLIVARTAEGRLCGLLPLVGRPLTRGGFTLREGGFPFNPNTILNDPMIMGAHASDIASALIGAAFDSRFETLILDHLPVSGGQAQALIEGARLRGARSDLPRESRGLYFADISGGHAAYMATRSRDHRWQIKKTLRKASEAGKLRIVAARGATEIGERLDEWFAVERRSWQGQTPGAAMGDADRRFHALLLERLARDEVGTLWLVYLDGIAVSALRMIDGPGRTAVHTMHFDADCRKLAPGLIAFDAMLRDGCARGLTEIDMHGTTDFFARWATGQRRHVSLRLYRPGVRGQALQAARLLAKSLQGRFAGRVASE
ncbi:GNAT family N-acetyltransferase [Paracoccus ravus]|uniref:GNAT family N-acetyltransferase n=1 Tax=Paracoccus ravus TaxID=2447760 RepID=UPI00143196BF|nr:GNAT family N-acetyltransferase [Paracoccus ravus]